MTATIRDRISGMLRESSDVKAAMIDACADDIAAAVGQIARCFENGNKVLLCGNGGSAADAQHIAAEFVVRLSAKRTRPALPAIALTTDTSYLTAGSNDFGYENVFARAVEALGKRNDILIALSTSGSSRNILNAVGLANSRGLTTIGFLGGTGGALRSLCAYTIVIPSDDTQRIQEGHITAAHIVCELVEETLFGHAPDTRG
jgi:D-sedoheptulose 7-phosphate isomerase